MIGWLIETLLATSLLMLAVLVLRSPVRQAFGSSVAYALWLLPVLRVILPPLPGDWRLSALVTPLVNESLENGIAFGVLNADRLPSAIARQALVEAQVNLGDEPIRMALVPPVAVADGPSVIVLLIGVWMVGALVFLTYHLFAHRAFCRRIQRRARHRSKVAGARVEVIETDAATGPLAFGIWRKYVAFPSDFEERYDADERELALIHELSHHARGDLIANWIALVVLALHWFNPLAWRAFRAFRADQEMACDARVLAGRSAAFTHAYGRAIVKSAHGGAVSAACHLHTINDLKGRLRMLSNARKSRTRLVGGALAVIAVGITGLGLTASGTQAAERLRTKMNQTIGTDLADLDHLAIEKVTAAASLAPLAPAQATGVSSAPPRAPAAPSVVMAPQAVPIPPSTAAPEAPPAPPAPFASIVEDVDRQEWFAADGKRHVIVITKRGSRRSEAEIMADGITVEELSESKRDGTKMTRVRLKPNHSSQDGKGLTTDELAVVTRRIPEISEGKCGTGRDNDVVMTDRKNGRNIIMICRNRIDRVTSNALEVAARSKLIERNALRSALDGVRNARAGMVANKNLTGEARASALKAMDEAIAELEGNLARVN